MCVCVLYCYLLHHGVLWFYDMVRPTLYLSEGVPVPLKPAQPGTQRLNLARVDHRILLIFDIGIKKYFKTCLDDLFLQQDL